MSQHNFNVGDKVYISQENLKIMKRSNRSLWIPSDSFIQKIENFVGDKIGVVTHRFPPGYEMTVAFSGGNLFHMKNIWVTLYEKSKKPVDSHFGSDMVVGVND